MAVHDEDAREAGRQLELPDDPEVQSIHDRHRLDGTSRCSHPPKGRLPRREPAWANVNSLD